MTANIIRNLPATLINWYKFNKNSKALLITGGDSVFEVLFDVLKEKCQAVTTVHFSDLEGVKESFDYIVIVDIIERVTNPEQFLNQARSILNPEGKLLIAVDNRFAIRYFCGDKDKYTGHVLDGIDNYCKVSKKRLEEVGGHAYAQNELSDMLSAAKLDKNVFYSVMPSLSRPQMLIKYGYTPNEALDIRVFPEYKSAETVFLEEDRLYEDLLKNNMFHQMANGYLIECTVDGKLCDADQITVQGDRPEAEAMATYIHAGELVKKKALHSVGQKKIDMLAQNQEYLKLHGIPLVDAWVDEDCFVMPYVEGEIATLHLRELLREDKNLFVEEMLEWKRMIEASSEHVDYKDVNWQQFEPNWEKRKPDDPNIDKWEKLAFGSELDKTNLGVILKRGYIDLVSLNCFYTSEGYKFFDQEFYIENFPANAILIRTVDFVYRNCVDLELILPREELLEILGIAEHQLMWRRKGNAFLSDLRNEKELQEYHKKMRRDYNTVAINRHRMDYSEEEYERLFKDIFKNASNKKIYLFGSGRYSERFVEQFGQYFNIAGVLDNNSEKWGMDFAGVKIMSPDCLIDETEPFKVYICIKFFEDVLTQLKNMGVRDISIYDSRLDYERPKEIVINGSTNNEPKKYHIGYVAGVFDLFHIGHVNLLRRAKEQCDYLIVGVVSDEQVIEDKRTSPYMCFEDRIAIVEACKYVDEAVGIPVDKKSTEAAWRMYHFDAQFSGSDYENDPYWMSQKAFLNKHGADLVFFPYTESTSSTKLKEQIRND